MIVVSDTSPLTNLWQIEAVYLLPKLFSEVLIPQEVLEELERLRPNTARSA